MSEGGWADSVHPLMASLIYVKMLVEYGANLVSYFDPTHSNVSGKEAFITASGYIGSTSLKSSHPYRFSPMRIRVWTLECKLAMLHSMMKAHL
jgi:hypothetical protein